MARQHTIPLLIEADDGSVVPLTPLGLAAGADAVSEDDIQSLIHRYPQCLPIGEIDPLFALPIPICRELNTPAGAIDNFMITASGLPVLVECKLWRNPEGRREVVGQILDYAKELSRWSSSDLQREVNRKLNRSGNTLLDLVRAAGHEADETDFNDAVTLNLRRGRFLLLIVGDGIREGVEAIAEYLQAHAGLHFTLGLVEMPIYLTPNGGRLVAPRVLAKTQLITRTVIAAPDNMIVRDGEGVEDPEEQDELSRISFWTEFLSGLNLDDPEQPIPRPGDAGTLTFSLPAPGGAAWLSVFRMVADWTVGVYLSYTRGSIGERVVRRIVEDWEDVRKELGGSVVLYEDKLGRPLIQDSLQTGSWRDSGERARALEWLRQRTNDFVNVMRPRVRAALADLTQDSS